MSRNLQNRMVDRYLNTVWAISSSRYVKWFVIGYTSMEGKRRYSAYQARGYDHLIILADRLTRTQALNLEMRIQEQCKWGSATGDPYRRKYHPEHRDLHYCASSGQGSPEPLAKIHSVYMAWVEP